MFPDIAANRRIRFVYHGETEDELTKALGVVSDCPEIYESTKPPIGTIFVGTEYSDTWITRIHAFRGWNIVICRCRTGEIQLK